MGLIILRKSSALGLSIYSNVSVRLTCCISWNERFVKKSLRITGLRIVQSSLERTTKLSNGIGVITTLNSVQFCFDLLRIP